MKNIRDDRGLVHEACEVPIMVDRGHGRVDEDTITVTLCNYESSPAWKRTAAPITCLPCLGGPRNS